MKNKLDELRQGAAGSANVLFHVCTYYTACVLYLLPGTYHDTRPTGKHGEIVRGSIGEGCGLGGGAKKEERCSSPGQGRIEAVEGPRPRAERNRTESLTKIRTKPTQKKGNRVTEKLK